ncbi:hypothetical protein N1851_018775 [Merluccius polli]|uniref:Uncharacterized protein n=1 Tax=Merluccius polli TaxID=89951 RepID=A0AA47MN90_MERPO|nr:hypothetical protein N1851_018775 [Merluccius polli]
MKRRFHVLHGEISLSPERESTVITVCAILHNRDKKRAQYFDSGRLGTFRELTGKHKLDKMHASFKLLYGQHRVGLRAVVEVVGHLGHVPGHGAAQRDADRLAGGGGGARRHPQQARERQQDWQLVRVHLLLGLSGGQEPLHVVRVQVLQNLFML